MAAAEALHPPKRINLALQGGGAHGAFTWGVLDGFLADERIVVDGVTGTSAGAVNAVLFADGLAEGGRQAAHERLAGFWQAASRGGNLPAAQRRVLDRLFSIMPFEGSLMEAWAGAIQRYFSPYDLNPFDINPLEDLINRFVDFERLAAFEPLQVFVSATNVQTGKLTIFRRESLTCRAVMASACLPTLFRAVEIDGVPYWDGGYMANPALFPLYRTTEAEDIVIVQLNPVVRMETPTSPRQISNRINEITFNSPLMGELRAAAFVARLIDEGKLVRGRGTGQYRHINIHRIALSDSLADLTASSKIDNDYEFLLRLHEAGHKAARQFLKDHFDDIGVRSTLDLEAQLAAVWV